MAAAVGALLLTGCGADAFETLEPTPLSVPTNEAFTYEADSIRDLGEYGGVTYLGAKNQDGRTCIIFYATSEPDRPVEGCDASDVATASISTLGEATLHSQGVKRSDESTGQQVSDWLVIQAFPPS